MTDASSTEPIVLVGLMGAGKTSVGRLLAERLGRAFVDLDREIESAAGASVRDVFNTEGEVGFRAREATALAAQLSRRDGPVIATGGGVVTTPANLAALEQCRHVVWLRATPTVLAERVDRDGPTRPLLSGSAAAQALTRLDEERSPLYGRVATVVVDTDGLAPDEVVDTVVATLAAPAAAVAPEVDQ